MALTRITFFQWASFTGKIGRAVTPSLTPCGRRLERMDGVLRRRIAANAGARVAAILLRGYVLKSPHEFAINMFFPTPYPATACLKTPTCRMGLAVAIVQDGKAPLLWREPRLAERLRSRSQSRTKSENGFPPPAHCRACRRQEKYGDAPMGRRFGVAMTSV